MAEQDPSKWRRFQKASFSSKDLARRMKKVEGATVKHARRFVFKRWDNFREVRRRIALWTLAIGVLIGAAGLQFWWYQDEYRTEARATGGTYAEAVLGPVETLNPLFAQTSAEEAASELLFSRLLSFDQTGNLNYDLVDSMKIGEDQKTYTFTIRPDARWSDGLYVQAKDVVFTVNMIKDPGTRSTIAGWAGIKVSAIDDKTVQFELPSINAAFPYAIRALPILPEHKLRDVKPAQLRENSFSTQPVGSGPFTLRLLQGIDTGAGRKIMHMAQNQDYYKGRPSLDRIQLHVYNDTDSIMKALATSEVNAASDLSVMTANTVNTQRYTVDNVPVSSGVYAILNTASPTLQDVKVRKALQLATDTTAIRKAISDDLPALDLPFVAGQLTGSVPTAPAHNSAEATKLLDEAGWVIDGSTRKKDGQALTLTVVTTKNPDFEKALELLTKQWQELGVTITTNIVDPRDPAQNVAQEVLQQRRFDVLLNQISIGDQDVSAYWHSSQASKGFNFSNYKNAIADDALVSARARLEPDLRNAKYITFANQWLSDVPAIGLYQATAQYVHTNSVNAIPENAKLNSAVDRYNTVRDWTVGYRTIFKTP